MEKLVKVGKLLYAVPMIVLAVHKLFYGELSNMIMPPWPIHSNIYSAFTYIGNLALILICFAIISKTKARLYSLIFGTTLLGLFLLSYVPFELILEPYSSHLPLWTEALKEFAFAGGAFVIAGISPEVQGTKSNWIRGMEFLIPYGHAFFCITMISFGLMHLLYIAHVSKLVPAWIPFPIFWTGLSGVALIASGLCIVARFKLRLVSNMLALMILTWFLMLHVPRVIEMALLFHGNEIGGALSALIFAGTALMIGNSPSAGKVAPKKFDNPISRSI